ncbi:pentatricopeptide repeat-containing protein At1g79540 [Argentina anserina]|uniref:pentatricopeptide repeat-containing protein At1g79540 n=1 Tax=Argentina anserina TaxID=57926 RepID=UPI002176819C|nr:pentatricopeptide repeat-containing protein At1g79540 [Potentilla anserina]
MNLLRPIYYFIPKPPWRRRYSTTQPDPIDLLTVLDKSDGAESLVSHLSNPKLISLIKQNQTNPQVAFRLFIWATQRSHLCATKCRSAVIDMLLRDQSAFEMYWRTMQEMKDYGVGIGCGAFSVLIRGYDKMGIAEKAVEAFTRMKEFDCKADVFTYNEVLYVLVRKEVFLLALGVYNQMLKCNVSPNRNTYSILINGFCKTRKTQDALQMFDEMTSRGIAPNTVTYTIVISGLCHAKRVHEAHRLVDTMKEKGCVPDLITYHALLDGYCKLGRLDEAYALVRSFVRDGYVLGIEGYSSLIYGLFRGRSFDEALGWYGKMISEGIKPDVILCTILIKGLADGGRVKDALKFLGEMSENGLVPDAYCYSAVIKGFCDLGLLDEARSLYLEISEQYGFPNACTYTILICGMCRNGLVGEAEQIFNEMEKVGCVPSVVTFNALIDGLCKASQLKDAQMLFYKMEIGKKPSLFLRLSQGSDRVIDSASLQKKVEQLCESGSILQAYKLLMQLASSGVAPDVITYNTLINGFCKNGNIDSAFKLFKDMQFKGINPDSVTYGTLIDGLQRIEREEDAFVVFNHMVKNGCTPNFEVYKSLMTWSCRNRKVSLAFSLWLKYLSSLPHRKEEAIKAIEENFKEGKIEKAIQGLLKMDEESKHLDLGPYTILLIGLCQVQRVDEALRMFSVLQEYKVNVTPPSCVHLINGLCREGNLDLAINVFHYTLGRGFILMPEICNKLLKCLLRSRDKKGHAFDLVRKMRNFGYDLDACLHQTTKLLLQ